MKNLFIALVALVAVGCSKSGGDPINKNPEVPDTNIVEVAGIECDVVNSSYNEREEWTGTQSEPCRAVTISLNHKGSSDSAEKISFSSTLPNIENKDVGDCCLVACQPVKNLLAVTDGSHSVKEPRPPTLFSNGIITSEKTCI